ncbi:MAG: hypothetical protein WCF65_01660 [Parachlamydiaceae bacterium]
MNELTNPSISDDHSNHIIVKIMDPQRSLAEKFTDAKAASTALISFREWKDHQPFAHKSHSYKLIETELGHLILNYEALEEHDTAGLESLGPAHATSVINRITGGLQRWLSNTPLFGDDSNDRSRQNHTPGLRTISWMVNGLTSWYNKSVHQSFNFQDLILMKASADRIRYYILSHKEASVEKMNEWLSDNAQVTLDLFNVGLIPVELLGGIIDNLLLCAKTSPHPLVDELIKKLFPCILKVAKNHPEKTIEFLDCIGIYKFQTMQQMIIDSIQSPIQPEQLMLLKVLFELNSGKISPCLYRLAETEPEKIWVIFESISEVNPRTNDIPWYFSFSQKALFIMLVPALMNSVEQCRQKLLDFFGVLIENELKSSENYSRGSNLLSCDFLDAIAPLIGALEKAKGEGSSELSKKILDSLKQATESDKPTIFDPAKNEREENKMKIRVQVLSLRLLPWIKQIAETKPDIAKEMLCQRDFYGNTPLHGIALCIHSRDLIERLGIDLSTLGNKRQEYPVGLEKQAQWTNLNGSPLDVKDFVDYLTDTHLAKIAYKTGFRIYTPFSSGMDVLANVHPLEYLKVFVFHLVQKYFYGENCQNFLSRSFATLAFKYPNECLTYCNKDNLCTSDQFHFFFKWAILPTYPETIIKLLASEGMPIALYRELAVDLVTGRNIARLAEADPNLLLTLMSIEINKETLNSEIGQNPKIKFLFEGKPLAFGLTRDREFMQQLSELAENENYHLLIQKILTIQDGEGNTPLHNHPFLIECLKLTKKVNINLADLKNSNDFSPLDQIDLTWASKQSILSEALPNLTEEEYSTHVTALIKCVNNEWAQFRFGSGPGQIPEGYRAIAPKGGGPGIVRSAATIKSALNNMLDKIQNRIAGAGTPGAHEPEKLFQLYTELLTKFEKVMDCLMKLPMIEKAGTLIHIASVEVNTDCVIGYKEQLEETLRGFKNKSLNQSDTLAQDTDQQVLKDNIMHKIASAFEQLAIFGTGVIYGAEWQGNVHYIGNVRHALGLALSDDGTLATPEAIRQRILVYLKFPQFLKSCKEAISQELAEQYLFSVTDPLNNPAYPVDPLSPDGSTTTYLEQIDIAKEKQKEQYNKAFHEVQGVLSITQADQADPIALRVMSVFDTLRGAPLECLLDRDQHQDIESQALSLGQDMVATYCQKNLQGKNYPENLFIQLFVELKEGFEIRLQNLTRSIFPKDTTSDPRLLAKQQREFKGGMNDIQAIISAAHAFVTNMNDKPLSISELGQLWGLLRIYSDYRKEFEKIAEEAPGGKYYGYDFPRYGFHYDQAIKQARMQHCNEEWLGDYDKEIVQILKVQKVLLDISSTA